MKTKHSFYLSFIVLILLVMSTSDLNAQSQKNNLVQIKYNLNYFKGYENYYISGILLPNFAFTKFFVNSPVFIGFEVDELTINYQEMYRISDIGDVNFRTYILAETKIGYQLYLTNRISLLAKTGLGLRFGQEGIVANVFPWNGSNGYGEPLIRNKPYQDLGVEGAVEILYRFDERWSLSLGGGVQYFLTRKATNKHLRSNFGIGYSF